MSTYSKDELAEALKAIGDEMMRAAKKHQDALNDDMELIDGLNALLYFYANPQMALGLMQQNEEAMSHLLTAMVGLVALGMEREGKETVVAQWTVVPDLAETKDKIRQYFDGASPEARQWILGSLGPEAQVVLTTIMEVLDENESLIT